PRGLPPTHALTSLSLTPRDVESVRSPTSKCQRIDRDGCEAPAPLPTLPSPHPTGHRDHNLGLTPTGTRRISRPMSSADHHTDSDELDPDEPRTPMWLPLLGGGLFLLALFLFLATRTDEEPTDE